MTDGEAREAHARPAGAAPPPAAASDGALDVLVVGDLNPDLLVSGEDVWPRFGQVEQEAQVRFALGGSAAIAAAGMARLGLATALCAAIGDDDLGAAARRMVREHGVRDDALVVRRGRPSGASIHLLAGSDRATWTDRGAMGELTAADAIGAIAGARPRHVHLAGLYLVPALLRDGAAIVAAAHAAGATVSVDTNFDPAGRFDCPPWLTRVDALLPNEAEALQLTGAATLSDAVTALAAHGALVAVKRGARGALAARGGEAAEIVVPPRLVPFADAVGAGDSFDAGFVRALVDGLPLRDALGHAVAAGTCSTRAAGGTAAQATQEEVGALAEELLR